MNNESVNENNYEIIEIIENVKIIYKCGKKDFFGAVHMTDEGVFTGRIVTVKKNNIFSIITDSDNRKEKSFFYGHEVFIECGFIPIIKIYEIKGDSKRKILWRKS